MIETKATIDYDIIYIELFKAKDEKENQVYLAQLVIVLDAINKLYFNFPIDMQFFSKDEAIQTIVKSMFSLFYSVGSTIIVIDIDTGAEIEKIDLHTYFGNKREFLEQNSFFVENESKILH